MLHTAADDDLLARVRVAVAHGQDAGAAALYEEGGDVARDEHLGEDAGADEGVLLALHGADDAAQDHVDRGGEEDRR